MPARDLTLGLVRLHVLHHAAEGPVYGHWMIQELARHGYRLGAGTLYPLLHGLERDGLVRSRQVKQAGRTVRVYRATPAGRRALAAARGKVRELHRELAQHPASKGKP